MNMTGINAINDIAETVTTVTALFEAFKSFLQRPGNKEQEISEQLLTRIEDLFLVVVGLSQAESFTTAMVLTLQYARTYYDKSFVSLLTRFFDQMRVSQLDDQEPAPIPREERRRAWKVFQRQAGSGLSLLEELRRKPLSDRMMEGRNNEMTQMMRHCVNALIIIGFMPEKAESILTTSVYRFIDVRMNPKADGLDFLESVFHCVDWVVQCLIPAYEQEDWSLLWGKNEIADLSDSFVKAQDAVMLMMQGRMDLVKKKYEFTTEGDVLFFVEDLALKYSMYLSSMKKDKTSMHFDTVTKRLVVLHKLAGDIYATLKETPLREKPFGILIHGDSGVSKSTVLNIINGQLCAANGFKCDNNSMVFLNAEEKFHSAYRTWHITFVFDDVGNTRPERTQENPLLQFIQFLNTMHFTALSPEADKKGKMQVLPKLGFATSNKKDLNAAYYSINPTSVLRRFEFHLGIKLRAEAIDPTTGMLKKEFVHHPCPDVWLITVEHIRIVRMGGTVPDICQYVEDLRDASIYDTLDFLVTQSIEHFRMQRALVERQTDLFNAPRCPEHHYPVGYCPHCKDCGRDDIESEPLDHEAFIKQMGLGSVVDKMRGIAGRAAASNLIPHFEEGFLPEEVFSSDFDASQATQCGPRERITELCEMTIGTLERYRRDYPITTLAGIGLSLVALYQIFKQGAKLFCTSAKLELQRSLQPFMAGEKQQDFWRRPVFTDHKVPEASKTTPVEAFEAKLWKNLAVFRVVSGEKKFNVYGFPVGGCDWLVPYHAIEDAEHGPILLDVSLERDTGCVGYKVFSQYLHWRQVARVTGADLAVVRLPAGGSVGDFTKFVQTAPVSGHSKLYFRDNSLKEHARPMKVWIADLPDYGVGYTQKGYRYTTDFQTFKGLCGAVIVSNGKNPQILGMHVAGAGSNGAGAIITQEAILAAKASILEVSLHQAASIPDEEYGFQYNVRPEVHYKNPVCFLPGDKEFNLAIYGQTDLPAARFRSSVAVSPISGLVAEVMQKPRAHTRPPTHQDYFHYQRDLEVMGEVRPPMDPLILNRSLLDLKLGFDEFYAKHPEFADAVGLLSYEEAINGIPGAVGIDHINLNTSVANPLRGPKSKYATITTDGDKYTITFDPTRLDVRKRYDEIIADLKAGRRVNAQFAVFLKDEAVTFEKYDAHKVRTIGACQIAFTLVVRSYFLSLMAARRRFPLHFESAVGCNAAGKDWRCFAESLRDHGRIINGDYKGFDKRLHAEVILATFKYYDYIFERVGQTPEFRKVAMGIGAEIAHPIYEVKGALIGVAGSNPSGQPLTVEVNNDCNRLYMRYAYYAAAGSYYDVPRFADAVDLLCYGDDNIASVSSAVNHFDHTVAARELEKIGVMYTMADKKSESVPFIHLDQADLLKRKFKHHGDLGCVVGPIEEDSIFKSLHMWKTDSPLCEGEYMAGVLRQALDEWFLHGRETYDVRRQQVLEIANRHVCYPPITDFLSLPTFDDLVARFHDTTSVMEEFPQSVVAERSKVFVKQSGHGVDLVDELEYVDGDCGPEYLNTHLVAGDYVILLVSWVVVVVYSYHIVASRIEVDWTRFRIPWYFPILGLKDAFMLVFVARSVVGFYNGVNHFVTGLRGPTARRRIIAPHRARYRHSKVVGTHMCWNAYVKVLLRRRLLRQAGISGFPASSSSALKRELVEYFLIHRAARREHWLKLQRVNRQILEMAKYRRVHKLDWSVVMEELLMLAANEGQTIVVPCPSVTHGMHWEDRVRERERTYKRCQLMGRAWIALKLYDSPLFELLGRDEYFRVLSFGVPLFEPVSPSDYFSCGGFGKQAVKFRNELESLSFQLPETRLSWSRLEQIAQNNKDRSSREDSRSKPPPSSVPDTQKQEVMEFTIQAGEGVASLEPAMPDTTGAPDITNGTTGATDNSQAIGGFDDFNETVEQVGSSPDPGYDMATTEEASFDQWFRRPTPILNASWDINNPFIASFAPWDLWAKLPRVANRLTNYRNFRGTLHLKFMLNGNGFYWGRMLAAYDPWSTFYGAPIFSAVEHSQKPHLWLDPTNSVGGEMVLPFVHEFNAVDMTEAGAFLQMGTVELRSVVSLRHATSSQPVALTVWAWCEDVVLSGPTQVNMDGLVAQAGSDEFGKGPISKPASLVASAAGKLAKVPVIGKYALATQMGARAIGGIAAMFGYSRPPVVTDPCLNSPLPAGNLASVDAADTSRPMALTSKQEVSIDPRTVGLTNVDEMSIAYLAAKESYIAQFDWAYNATSADLLWNCGVSPIMNTVVTGTTGEGYDLTPMAFAAHPFRYWCGSVTYRFQIVCSNFHKGRMLIAWDPVVGASPATVQPITKYHHVIDIAEQRDFEITVGWGSDQPALETPPLSEEKFSTALTTWDTGHYNGTLSVYVLNELVSSSNTTQPITVLVSVKSNELNVYGPHEERLNNLSYIPNPAALQAQAGSGITMDDENQPNTNALMPEGTNVIATFGKTGISKAQLAFCVGEDVPSFRSCVKRYSQHTLLAGSTAYNSADPDWATSTLFIHKQPAFPYMYGYDTLGVDRSGVTPCNRCTFTLLNYLSTAYVGWRGSMRWKLVPFKAPCCSWMAEARRCGSNCNYEDNSAGYTYTLNPDPIIESRGIREAFQADLNGGWDGSVATATQHNPVLEFQIPYYNKRRFLVIPEHTATDSSEGMGWWFRFSVNVDKETTGITSASVVMNTYVAAGDDFSFYFFKGVPRLYESTVI
nr:MAG: hypothetical protein [Marnaviridae sp.]